jgi:ABC-2 type transport system permease protein
MDIAVTQEGQSQMAMETASAAPAKGSVARLISNTWAITKKELSLYFSTPLAYVLLGVFILIMGFFFVALIHVYEDASLRAQQFEQFQPGILDRLNFTDVIFLPLFRNAGIVYVFMVPFLTMRLIADEKRQNTFQLLMTTPIRPWEIVFGKFVSSQIVLTVSLLLTVAFPVLLNTIAVSGGVEWQTAVAAYLGYFLFTMAFVAVGLFFSSITDSPVAAAFITLGVLLVLHILSFLGGSFEGVAKEIVDYVCASTHLQGFLEGTIRLSDVTYFLSLTALGLVLTRTAIERTRW